MAAAANPSKNEWADLMRFEAECLTVETAAELRRKKDSAKKLKEELDMQVSLLSLSHPALPHGSTS